MVLTGSVNPTRTTARPRSYGTPRQGAGIRRLRRTSRKSSARRSLTLWSSLGLFLAVVGSLYLLRGGYVPTRYLPFAEVDVGEPGVLLIRDWSLAALRRDRSACVQVLDHPSVEVELIPDKELVRGCGWENAVRVSEIAGAEIKPATLSCPVAAALAMWVNLEVQPAAGEHLGQDVVGITHFGSYACRNIRSGTGLGSFRRSEHATADAIDIAGFRLRDGSTVSVLRDWKAAGERSKFLRAVHRGACRYFRVVLGPEANALHRNHFHLDRGWLWSCR